MGYSNLPKADRFSASDPVVIVAIENPNNGVFERVGQTEIVKFVTVSVLWV